MKVFQRKVFNLSADVDTCGIYQNIYFAKLRYSCGHCILNTFPDEIHNFAKLKKTTSIPLSGGEHEYSRYGFHDLLQAEALDIFQFDTNRVGGFTEAQKICNMALAHGVEVIPHGGQMHNLHVVMSSFASPMAEYFPKTEIEVGNEMFWYIFDGEAVAKNGKLQLDDNKPGVGLTLKTEGLDDFNIVE